MHNNRDFCRIPIRWAGPLRAVGVFRRGPFPIGLLLLGTAALFCAAGCARGPANRPAVGSAAAFVDEAECRTCHQSECDGFRSTHHASTLHVASREELGRLMPPSGPIAGTGYHIRQEGGRLIFASDSAAVPEKTVDLALGSGKLGMTYVALHPDDRLTELRMSWFPGLKQWYLTPGQEEDADNEVGEVNDSETARNCLGCHSVTAPEKGLRPDRKFFGVGCQSCHGPASLHVAAKRAGRAELGIERVGAWGAARLNAVCGRCHRNPEKVGTTGDEVTMTQRFQPYGLSQSACFQKSMDRLTCIVCHDPHANAETDTRHYESACLRCHTAPGAPAPVAGVLVQSRACPVNPRTGCIACHMPKRQVFPLSRSPIKMADHLIWAYSAKRHPR